MQPKIRVVHFLHRIPPEYSGAALQALRLIERFQLGSACKSSVVAYSEGGQRHTVPDGIPCSIIRIRRSLPGKIVQYGKLFAAIARSRADIVHVHGYHRPAVWFAAVLRKKILLKTTLFGVDDLAAIRRRSTVDRMTVGLIDRVVSLTYSMSKANAPWASEERIPNGVDTTRFGAGSDRTGARRQLNLPEDEPVFLFVGGDSPRKGFDSLPEAWRHIRRGLPDRTPVLVVIGKFRNPSNSHWLTDQLRGSEHVVIDKVVEDMPVWLGASDVLLSLSRQEGLPNSVLEAVCMDRFVAAQDIPDTYTGILNERNSVIVRKFDGEAVRCLSEALAEGRHRQVDNSAIRQELDIDVIARRYVELYGSIVSRPRTISPAADPARRSNR